MGCGASSASAVKTNSKGEPIPGRSRAGTVHIKHKAEPKNWNPRDSIDVEAMRRAKAGQNLGEGSDMEALLAARAKAGVGGARVKFAEEAGGEGAAGADTAGGGAAPPAAPELPEARARAGTEAFGVIGGSKFQDLSEERPEMSEHSKAPQVRQPLSGCGCVRACCVGRCLLCVLLLIRSGAAAVSPVDPTALFSADDDAHRRRLRRSSASASWIADDSLKADDGLKSTK